MLKEKLEEKVIKFYEDELLGIKDKEGKLWLGVNKTCQNLGFNEADSKNQVTKINNNTVLRKLSLNFQTQIESENGVKQTRESLFISEKGIPLWLAKINVTDKMKLKYPELSDKLEKYQFECADILHQAFFETEEQKEKLFDELGLEGKIVNLESKIDAQTGELKATQDKLNTLIDNSTINSRQASRLLTHAKDRVSTMLGGAHSAEYKKNSRTYFKNLWLQLCQEFEVTTYKDLNPLNYGSAVTFISNWSFS